MADAFADFADVEKLYEGTINLTTDGVRVQYLLDTTSARLRLLLPSLVSRIDADTSGDLALSARDVVAQAVARRMGGTVQQVRSESEGIGPFSRTLTYTTDKSGTFPDEDLALLSGSPATVSANVGTINLAPPNWHRWGAV